MTPAIPTDSRASRRPLIVEDVLLLLFQPTSGSILGEDVLFYVLGGAVLGDLALGGFIELDGPASLGGRRVRATGTGPGDVLLRPAWERIAAKPRDAQTVLAESGPLLRGPAIDRLVERGHLQRESRKVFGLFDSTKLAEGASGRRAEVLTEVRPVFVDGATASPRVLATAGLLAASSELVNLHREIPWNSAVARRAVQLQYGTTGARAAAAAVLRTDLATYVGSLMNAGIFNGPA